ncbi:hypothetical protein FQZ97_1215700 [compost metagenome]
MVRLAAFDRHAELGTRFMAQALHIGERVAAVLFGLARAEQVEVGAVEDEDFLHDGSVKEAGGCRKKKADYGRAADRARRAGDTAAVDPT